MFETLKFGDKIYVLSPRYSKQTKFEMVDPQGLTWYRYDTPPIIYTIRELQYSGKVTLTVEGTVSDDLPYTEYAFIDTDSGDWESFYKGHTYDNVFATLSEAEAETVKRNSPWKQLKK